MQVALIGLASVVAVMTLVWLVSIRVRNVSIVDVFWGLAFVLLAWEYWWLFGGAQTARHTAENPRPAGGPNRFASRPAA